MTKTMTNYRQAPPEAAPTLSESELAFCREHGIQILEYDSPDYPERLRGRSDAPRRLFYLGAAPLNSRHVISVVGTRRITQYGKDICERLTAELSRLLPDALVVSGLAYGVDIHAHRGALNHGLQTIGVLAHGLDRIYPYAHRDTARLMTRQGGLLTEYVTGTEPERYNFVHRNRIVAGMADCTIVVESAQRGGSMITANLAHDMGRPVFAVPGRVGDAASEGCNRLIADGLARIHTDLPDLLISMGWQQTGRPVEVQQSLFPELNAEEKRLVEVLRGTEGLTADMIEAATGVAAFQISSVMMDLEMQGIVSTLPGGVYRLSQT